MFPKPYDGKFTVMFYKSCLCGSYWFVITKHVNLQGSWLGTVSREAQTAGDICTSCSAFSRNSIAIQSTTAWLILLVPYSCQLHQNWRDIVSYPRHRSGISSGCCLPRFVLESQNWILSPTSSWVYQRGMNTGKPGSGTPSQIQHSTPLMPMKVCEQECPLIRN